jgi:spermidine/putrescine-binding protein
MPSSRALAHACARAGVEVEAERVDSNEELERRMRAAGPYDVVCPSDYMVERLRGEGRLAPVDAERLPGRAQLASWALDPAWDPGLEYSTPVAFGTTGILFRRDAGGDADGWDTLFQPAGAVGMLSEVREVVGAALLAAGRSINETAPAALAEAAALLEAQAPRVRAYTSADFVTPVEAGAVVAHHAWSGPSALAVRRDRSLGYSVPREGACLWVTTAAVPADAPEPDDAHRLIAALLEPQAAAANVLDEGFATPLEPARASLPAEVREDPVLFPTPADLARCQTLRDVGREADAAFADVYVQAASAWHAARGA